MDYTWTPPRYLTSTSPSLKTSINDFKSSNFARIAKWCPDGSTFLAQCEDRSFRLFDTLNQCQIFNQPSPVLDFLWYPTASPLNPASYCFVASVRECPVKLLDASDGRLRASYRIVDHRERQIAPHSLAFNLTAERLYCGFEDAVEVFDVSRPGEGTRLPTTPSKKSKDGLKGIISALAFVPSQGSDIYAAGSLTPSSSNIALFSETQGQEPIMFISNGPKAGITQIMFNPMRPHIMYSAYRRHGSIYSWDLRSNLDFPLKIYNSRNSSSSDEDGARRERTNQKLRFDVDISGSWLASGDQCGTVSIFDLKDSDTSHAAEEDVHLTETEEVKPILEFEAHGDAIGSVAFNPIHPTLLSVSGSRHFESPESESSDSSSSSDDDEEVEEEKEGLPPKTRTIRKSQPRSFDSSIKTWSFSGSTSQVASQDPSNPTDGLAA